MKALLGDPVEDFAAYEPYIRLDAHVGDESFLDVYINRLYVDPEGHFKFPGREHFRHRRRTGRAADSCSSMVVVIPGGTIPFGAAKFGFWCLIPHRRDSNWLPTRRGASPQRENLTKPQCR
jgi:hypothetical protein